MTTNTILDIAEEESLNEELGEWVLTTIRDTDEDSREPVDNVIKEWYKYRSFEEDTCKIIALMQQTNEDFETCKIYIGNIDWLVYTDEEAEEAWEESLYNYIDDCVLPELPDKFHSYFNKESFMSDCKMDSRGSSLSSYDGVEHEETVNNITYYLYRCN